MFRSLIRCTLATGILLAAGAVPALAAEKLPIEGTKSAPLDSQVTFRNDSDWAIHALYFARESSKDWGQEQLGKHTVRRGESFTLSQIPCGRYDVKLVDEDGDECDVTGVALCAESHVWAITDKDLLKCQAHTKR